jgi:hypothetical protein
MIGRVSLIAALLLGPVGGQGLAGVFDDLQCFKIRTNHQVAAIADVVPSQGQFPLQPFCKISGPKLLCIPTDVQNVTPPPPGAPPGVSEGYRLCYKLQCRQPVPSPVLVGDEFGVFSVSFKSSSLVCTPATLGGVFATTSTTSSMTTSTTSPTTSAGGALVM